MKNDKYQQMLYERIKLNFQNWEQMNTIQEKEIYTFLHNLKGTAGSIGMLELSTIAAEKLEKLDETSDKSWEKEDWKPILAPILEVVSFFETNQVVVAKEKIMTNNNLLSKDQNFILVIDDDIVFISYLKNVLEKHGYMVIVTHNGKIGLELIYELNPAMVFIDLMLTDMNGFSILESINETKKNQMFVAIVSVKDSKENRKKAYDLGAFDFIAKPIEEEILIAYVANRLRFKKALEYSSVTDELTQVYNRKFLNTQLQNYYERNKLNGEKYSIGITDIDFFKQINDTHGHLVGDEVLKGFASLMMASKRETDIFCRYSGEEFALLMPDTTAKTAYAEMEKLRKLMLVQQFTVNGKNFSVTFSSGVAEIDENSTHPITILEQADLALNEAKKFGKNQTVYYGDEIATNEMTVKIIVIDDVYIIRNLIKSYFEKTDIVTDYKIEVETYHDGVSFLKSNWYNETNKYIILLDDIMPEMDGIEVLKQIRKEYSSNKVLISMLTGRKGEEHVWEALSNGANDYILKPFNIEDVADRIIHLINRLLVKVK